MSAHRWRWLVMAPAIAMVASGCGRVQMAVVEPTIPVVVDDGLETLTTEENQDRIRTQLNLVEVGEMTEELAAAPAETLELVTSAAKEHTQAGSPAFVRMVKSNGEGSVAGRALSDFLDERGHLKANVR